MRAGEAQDHVAAWLQSLQPGRLTALARDCAAEAWREGLATEEDGGERVGPIPVTLTPEVFDPAAFGRLADDAHTLLAAASKAACWAVSGDRAHPAQAQYRNALTAGGTIGPVDPATLKTIATARLDFFPTAGDGARLLEINSSIPAMQGYSDIAAHTWVRHIAEARGLGNGQVHDGTDAISSNSANLLNALIAHYRVRGGRAPRPAILIVSRRGDDQQQELRYLKRRFEVAGHRALHVYADEVSPGTAGAARARGEDFDIVYRHIFTHLVPPESPFGHMLHAPAAYPVFNPVAARLLEEKALLGLLHEAGEERALAAACGLNDADVDAICRLAPWTRVLRSGPATLPDGSRTDDLAAWVAEHPGEVVLKRSWDFGGHSVLLGAAHETEAGRARLERLFGADCTSWKVAVGCAVRDDQTWVAQAYVLPQARRHLLVEPTEAGPPALTWRDLFVDRSVFISLGTPTPHAGGACRVSTQAVVNIHRGGGMAPFIPATVIDTLFAPHADAPAASHAAIPPPPDLQPAPVTAPPPQ